MQRFTKINIKDGVPSNYSLVYRTSMENYVEPSKYVAIGGAVLSVAVLPVLVLDPGRLFHSAAGQFYLTSSMEVWGFWFIVLAHCVACYKIAHSVPLRIYHSQKEDNFLFIFNHKFHLNKKEIVVVGTGQLEECPVENDIWREVSNLHQNCIFSYIISITYKKLLGFHRVRHILISVSVIN